MFRLQEKHLPPDPEYPADLKKLGFFINDVGQFRMIDFPDKDYIYYHTTSERHNDIRREAYQTCQRNEVEKRLSALGIEKLYLPQLTTTKPQNEPHVPILAPPPEILKTRKRVVVIVNDSLQDLGVLAYRQLQRDRGVNGGSVIDFAKEVIERSGGADDKDIWQDGAGITDKVEETPGLIVMNCGQLLYSYKNNQAMTMKSWSAMPRKSMCHEAIQITDDNHIEGNHDAVAHIRFVFDKVIHNKDFVAEDAEIYVVGIENGAEKLLLNVLMDNFDHYSSRITAMAFMNPFVTGVQITNPRLKAFVHARARQWKVSAYEGPRLCTEVPSSYDQELEILDSSAKNGTVIKDEMVISASGAKPVKDISWLETIQPSSAISTITNLIKSAAISAMPRKKIDVDSADPWGRDDMEPICPTFADAENPFGAGECVFTSPLVQRAVLDFFEEVAQDPRGYRNPIFKVTVTDPWTQSGTNETDNAGEEDGSAAFAALQPPEMTPEHADLDAKKSELETMRAALRDLPKDRPELEAGRQNLETRIAKKEEEVAVLTRKTLAIGGLQAGEAKETRSTWKPVGTGPKIPFAGTMVDSELVKGAGLEETAEEELAALEGGAE